MSRSTPSLKQFIKPVPTCDETADLAKLLHVFQTEQCDRLVVLNPQQYPLGILHLHRLISYLQKKNNSFSEILQHSTSYSKEYTQVTPSIVPADIEPITTLSDSLNLQQFWPHLEKLINTETELHLALVDISGQFLGLLDSWLLLNYINSNKNIDFYQSIEDSSTSATAPEQQEYLNNPNFQLLTQLLEQLPLALSLQTETGQVISQNLAWREQIGAYPNLNYQESDRSSSLPIDEIVSKQIYAQNYCQIDNIKKTVYPDLGYDPIWPHKSFGYNPSQVILSPVTTIADEKITPDTVNFNAYTKDKRERIWQFITVPLANLQLAELGSQEIFDGQNFSSFLPTEEIINSKLILVLAQDLTEQQQVAKELAAKNADLLQLNRLKDEFLACVSHELKTPLTSIIGLSSLLKDQLIGQLNEKQLRYAQLIHSSGRQLMTIVNDILDLTRMETGQMELTPDLVDIKSACDRAYLQACERHSQHPDETDKPACDFPFQLEIEPGLETIIADELRLRQMLFHLLSNAIKFTPIGDNFGLKVSRWDSWIAFTVWDNGIGIPPEKQHLIFQKFQQLENPLTRKFDGTGLGLVLTQRLAHLHGGDISFISNSNQGSQFTLLLPPLPPQKSVDEDLPIPNFQSYCNRLVLIVEAAPQYIEDLRHHLSDLKYQVVIARSGTDALEKARRLQPAFILLNPLLPLLSGWDVLTLLKTDLQTKHIPVIITATQAEKDLAAQNQANGFLTIPIKREALQNNLSSLKKIPSTFAEKLTILHLTSELITQESAQEQKQADSLLEPASEGRNYQVIEVDDLEQAELLAHIWHLHVVLLDNLHLEDPLSYLKQLSQYTKLASLPLVTLDIQTTQAANQISNLSVFPYLAATDKDNTNALWQVIEVAAGIS